MADTRAVLSFRTAGQVIVPEFLRFECYDVRVARTVARALAELDNGAAFEKIELRVATTEHSVVEHYPTKAGMG